MMLSNAPHGARTTVTCGDGRVGKLYTSRAGSHLVMARREERILKLRTIVLYLCRSMLTTGSIGTVGEITPPFFNIIIVVLLFVQELIVRNR